MKDRENFYQLDYQELEKRKIFLEKVNFKAMLPNQNILDQINWKIKHISNKRGECLRKIHYGCYLLCSQSGLRISEAINFDLTNQTKNGLYRITKTKGKKERLIYVPQQVISELKKSDWKPNQTNRFNFYHFLRKIKQELKISKKVELTPHTLRRSFTTRHAEAGLPLPLLQKMLGHSSPRTTALYWQNTFDQDQQDNHQKNDDTDDILQGKKWLERHKPSQNREKEPPKLPSGENFLGIAKNPEPITTNKKPVQQDNSLLIAEAEPKSAIVNYQPKPLIREISQNIAVGQISPKNQGNEVQAKQKFSLNTNEEFPVIINQEKQQIQQDLTKKDKIIERLKQELVKEQEKRIIAEINLATQKQTNNNLHQQLQAERKINTNLTLKIQVYEQNYPNLQTTYQNTLKDKQTAEKQLHQLTTELANLARMLSQWQKMNYYQQLEQKQNELKAQIVQPPPWKR